LCVFAYSSGFSANSYWKLANIYSHSAWLDQHRFSTGKAPISNRANGLDAGKKHCFQAEKGICTAAQSLPFSPPPRAHTAGYLSAPHPWHFNLPSPSEDRQGSNDSSSIQAMSRIGSSPGYPYAPEKAGKQQQLKAEPHYDD
jgi:hypothetical protein